MIRTPSKVYATSWAILVFFFLVPLTAGRSGAEMNRCPCKYHSAVAQGVGTCSRSEDRARCTIEFSATTPEEYSRFVSKLQEFGLWADPRESLNFANKIPPEKWGTSFVLEKLPVLFAISQRFGFEDKILLTKKVIESQVYQILKALQDPTVKDCIKMHAEGFNLRIGYGCIEIYRDDFASMVKTPWSHAEFYCDFSTPPWFK